MNTITQVGRGTPFINVSFSGLLWGYNDELPCNSLTRPAECPAAPDEVDIFSQDSDGDDGDDGDEEDDWDWKRKKRDISGKTFGGNHVLKVDLLVVQRVKRHVENGLDLRAADHDRLTKEKAAFVDCKCEWGLFRDRNVTLRKPVRMNHGIKDLKDKGLVVEYDRYICMTR